MRRIVVFLAFTLLLGFPCFAQSPEPVGPSGWSMRNWIGFSLQIILFILALIGICRLGRRGDGGT